MKRLVLLLLIGGLLITLFHPITAAVEDGPWPTQGWAVSTPESQGIDSSKICALIQFIDKQQIPIHSLLIVRHGRLVTEAYFAPYRKDVIQDICSCTKSFASAAIGASIADGKIAGVDQKVLSFFPDRSIANRDALKESMTLENLLTMSAGLDWTEWGTPYSSERNVANQIARTSDWTQFVLDRKMAEPPGTRFNYNSGASLLLSAIVRQTNGKPTASYMEARIFRPLGIATYYWPADPTGLNLGNGGLAITPQSMAKFGYLYLKWGRWEGRQLIPAEWVAASTSSYVDIGRPGFGYGYQWWVDPWGYSARGWGGQYIFVIPAKDMVVVFTSGLPLNNQLYLPETLLTSFILPAARSSRPLPKNPESVKRLSKLLDSALHPQPVKPESLPALAGAISGKTIEFDPNPLGLRSVTFNFGKTNECEVIPVLDSGPCSLPVGLDDTYRHTVIPNAGEFALKGHWTSEDTFELIVRNLISPDVQIYRFTFADNKVRVDWRSYIESGWLSFEGHIKD